MISKVLLKADIKREFNLRYPNYRNELNVTIDLEKEENITLTFKKFDTVLSLKEFGESNSNFIFKEDLFWIEITTRFDMLVVKYERDNLGDTLHTVNDKIEEQLLEISQKCNMDMNTLWLAFKESLNELEGKIKNQY